MKFILLPILLIIIVEAAARRVASSATATKALNESSCPSKNYTCDSNERFVKPIGNEPITFTSFSLHGKTSRDSQREFLVDLGMISDMGSKSNPPVTPFHDKVTLYASVVARNGTGDVWAINPLVTQSPSSGTYNAQGIELDFNNNNAHRGDEDAGAGLAEPVSYGLAVTGAGSFRSTSAFLVSGNRNMWNRGITFANDCVGGSTFQDLGSPDKSVDIRGNPKYGIYQSSTMTENYFAGKTMHEGELLRKGQHVITTNSQTGREVVRSGNVILSKHGEAEIYVLSSYEEEDKNVLGEMDHTYHLTSIGVPSPNLHVKQEITPSTASFYIAGGVPNSKVSWSVRSK